MCATNTLIRHSSHNPTNPLGRFKVSDSDSSPPLWWQDEWTSCPLTLSPASGPNQTSLYWCSIDRPQTNKSRLVYFMCIYTYNKVRLKSSKTLSRDSLLTRSNQIPSRWINYSISHSWDVGHYLNVRKTRVPARRRKSRLSLWMDSSVFLLYIHCR